MGKLIGLGAVVLLLLFGIGTCAAGASINNSWVAQEQNIEAQYKQNQNNYDNGIKSVLEMAQVSDNYVDALKDVIKSANTARYGEDGSKAVFQFLKEQNPNLDPALFIKIQQRIEIVRSNFEAEQKSLLDKKRVYQTDLRTFPNTIFASFLGFPKIDLAKYDIVTSSRTEQAFETKKDEALDLRHRIDPGKPQK